MCRRNGGRGIAVLPPTFLFRCSLLTESTGQGGRYGTPFTLPVLQHEACCGFLFQRHPALFCIPKLDHPLALESIAFFEVAVLYTQCAQGHDHGEPI